MAILTVGAGQQYQTIGAAIAASNNGDTINVSAGTYTNDTATIDTSIKLQAVGGTVKLVETQALANEKGIFIVGDSSNAPTVTINGFSFTGAETPDGSNGAGIRYQAGSLTLNNDVFTTNQDGILATPEVAGTGSITIKNSEFASNGAGDGFSHNLYIGDVAQFTIENSYVHDAVVGHEIKSRAENNTITNNLIADNNGTSSYSIDLPNGGNATIAGNTIEQGPNGQNPVIIAYGEEGGLHTGTSLSISGNTFVNDMTSHAPTGVWDAGTATANLSNNSFWGITQSQVATGPNTQSGDVFLTSRPVVAPTVRWVGPNGTNRSGDFETAANWANGTLPTSSQTAIIGGTGTFTVTSMGTDSAASLLINAAGATLDIGAGALTILGTLKSAGTIETHGSGALVADGVLVNNHAIDIDGGSFTVASTLSGAGTVTIGGGGVLQVNGAVKSTQTIGFADATGTLALDLAQRFAGTVAGFVQGDALDLQDLVFRRASITSITGSGDAGTDTVLTIQANAHTATIALLNQFAGQFSTNAGDYTLSSDHTGTAPGTVLTLAAHAV